MPKALVDPLGHLHIEDVEEVAPLGHLGQKKLLSIPDVHHTVLDLHV
jgi:hypothetical protein